MSAADRLHGGLHVIKNLQASLPLSLKSASGLGTTPYPSSMPALGGGVKPFASELLGGTLFSLNPSTPKAVAAGMPPTPLQRGLCIDEKSSSGRQLAHHSPGGLLGSPKKAQALLCGKEGETWAT